MTKKDILDAWAHIRRVDSKTPDEVLDFMKDSALAFLAIRNHITKHVKPDQVPGGVAIVGEKGPEIILKKGQAVLSHEETRKAFKRVKPQELRVPLPKMTCSHEGTGPGEICEHCGYLQTPAVTAELSGLIPKNPCPFKPG